MRVAVRGDGLTLMRAVWPGMMRKMRKMERRRLLATVSTGVYAATVLGTVLGVVPYRLAGGRLPPALGGTKPSPAIGAAFMAVGIPLVVDSFVRFVMAAGTPAPVFETEELVLTGFYRYTRNPQYVGVLATLAGEALIYGSRRVLGYAAMVGGAFHVWILLYEEPRLRRRFGQQYERYARETPRWLWS
jgi:protein-S-isoprenylcysteine O-methyltransferase Ste14